MRQTVLAGLVLTLAFGIGAWAQTSSGTAQRGSAQAPAGQRFVDANGDGVCDDFAAGGRGFGRGVRGGYGRGMRGGVGGGFAFGPNGASLVDVVARVTGQDRTAVLQALQSGRSLAQIGEAGGKSVQDLAEAVVAERRATIGQAVSSGAMTRQQADQRIAWMRAQIAANLSGGSQLRGGGPGAWCPWITGTPSLPAAR